MRTQTAARRNGAIFLLFIVLSVPAQANETREEQQARLDAECEAAREKKLAPMREQFIEECVAENNRRGREECERFYADFGAQSGNRAPLFYDLPECVKAFEFQRQR